MTAAVKVSRDIDFSTAGKRFADRSAVLELVADIDGIHLNDIDGIHLNGVDGIHRNGVDGIHWNDDEIVEFKVMLRPLKALQAVMPAIAEQLRNP